MPSRKNYSDFNENDDTAKLPVDISGSGVDMVGPMNGIAEAFLDNLERERQPIEPAFSTVVRDKAWWQKRIQRQVADDEFRTNLDKER